jgi:hypothetical protein
VDSRGALWLDEVGCPAAAAASGPACVPRASWVSCWEGPGWPPAAFPALLLAPALAEGLGRGPSRGRWPGLGARSLSTSRLMFIACDTYAIRISACTWNRADLRDAASAYVSTSWQQETFAMTEELHGNALWALPPLECVTTSTMRASCMQRQTQKDSAVPRSKACVFVACAYVSTLIMLGSAGCEGEAGGCHSDRSAHPLEHGWRFLAQPVLPAACSEPSDSRRARPHPVVRPTPARSPERLNSLLVHVPAEAAQHVELETYDCFDTRIATMQLVASWSQA